MKRYQSVLIYGFAIFAMFFGSGNLVFPLQIGMNGGDAWGLGFLGLFITGIILPFLGLFVIKLHRGCYDSFFSEAGSLARWALPLFTLSLLGAFGVVPRCIAVAYGGVGYLYPQFSLTWFSIIFCVVCFIVCLKDHFMINVLGKWMTPILLISLIVLITIGIINAPEITNNIPQKSKVFFDGFLRGYQTMDLFAAFFFSALIFKQIQSSMPADATDRHIIKAALKPSLIGAGLLALIYLGFVFLGAHYQSIAQGVAPELILPTIATQVMGVKAALLIGIIIIFSCLTTAVALNNIYARYLCNLFKLDQKHFPWVLLGTTSISFCISLLDFRGIAAFLAPVLEVTYPSLIVLTVLGIFFKGHSKFKILPFYGLMLAMIWYQYGF